MIFRNCDFCSQTQHHAAPSSTGWSQRRWYHWTHIQIYIFRSSMPHGMEFLLSMEQFPPDVVLESLYKLRIRGSEKLKTVLELYNYGDSSEEGWTWLSQIEDNGKKEVSSRIWEWRILRPGTDIMKQAPWSRIIGNNVAFKEDKENVGNGKLTGGVRKETNAVSGTIMISVQDLRHRPLLLQNLRRHKMWEIQREPKVLEGCSPSGKMSRLPCKAHLKSTCTNPSCESCILQSVCFSRQKIDANFGKSVLMHTVGLMNSLPKSLKRMGEDKSAVAMLKDTRQLGCISQDMEPPKSSSILQKSAKKLEANPMCSIHQKPHCVTPSLETKNHRLE